MICVDCLPRSSGLAVRARLQSPATMQVLSRVLSGCDGLVPSRSMGWTWIPPCPDDVAAELGSTSSCFIADVNFAILNSKTYYNVKV